MLIIDEVVMGMGRTGKWFGYQQFGIRPDIVTMAKGLASGYAAISCTVTTEEVLGHAHSPNMPPRLHADTLHARTSACSAAAPAATLVL